MAAGGQDAEPLGASVGHHPGLLDPLIQVCLWQGRIWLHRARKDVASPILSGLCSANIVSSLQGPLADVLLVPLPGRSSEAELQWRLQVNRLQELIDQLECKVRGWVASAPQRTCPTCPSQCILEAQSIFCLLQVPRLEPMHEEDLTKSLDSVSLGRSTQNLSSQIW